MKRCALCKSNIDDTVRCGPFVQKGGVNVHMFCLFLTSNLWQRGSEHRGLQGFLLSDIQAEIRRIRNVYCFYCHERNANIRCCAPKCQHNFHLLCGLQHGASNQFVQAYKSYCHQHVRYKSHQKKETPAVNEICVICHDLVTDTEQYNILQPPCCGRGWFHKVCLQRFAQSAGYFFKCPLCNDTHKFRNKLPYAGIFIPDQDAAWELEHNAYADLLERPSLCCAPVCRNRRGRNIHTRSNKLLICTTCGAVGIHEQCMSNVATGSQYNCPECKEMLRGQFYRYSNIDTDNDEDIDVDVCNISEANETLLIEDISANNDGQLFLQNCNSRQQRRKRLILDGGVQLMEKPEKSSGSCDEEEVIRRPRKRAHSLIISDNDADDENVAKTGDSNNNNTSAVSLEHLTMSLMNETIVKLRRLGNNNENERQVADGDTSLGEVRKSVTCRSRFEPLKDASTSTRAEERDYIAKRTRRHSILVHETVPISAISCPTEITVASAKRTTADKMTLMEAKSFLKGRISQVNETFTDNCHQESSSSTSSSIKPGTLAENRECPMCTNSDSDTSYHTGHPAPAAASNANNSRMTQERPGSSNSGGYSAGGSNSRNSIRRKLRRSENRSSVGLRRSARNSRGSLDIADIVMH